MARTTVLRPPLALPEYIKRLPDDACIDNREMAALIGSKTTSGACSAASRGTIPSPDKVQTTIGRHGFKYVWKVGAVKQWHRDYWAAEANKEAVSIKPTAEDEKLTKLSKESTDESYRRIDLELGESLYIESTVRAIHVARNSTLKIDILELAGSGEKLLKITRIK